ncbi:hypothetical protein MJD09_11150 [bacterium]|nr:hypothetical protein [bacterium]
MMDPKFLETLGWSDELIEAAQHVAAEIPSVVSAPAERVGIDFSYGGTSTSNELDLSGSPVGTTELRIDPK